MRPAAHMKRLYDASVFRGKADDCTMSDVFATLFHRLAATLYLLYGAWGGLVAWDGIGSLTRQQGAEWTTIFAMFVLLLTIPACIGATFFPEQARLELYAGAAFSVLMLIYYYFLVVDIVQRGAPLAGLILPLSVVVMPVARSVIVMRLLLMQARARRPVSEC